MLVVGILIIIIATLMILFPEFFMKLKSPRIPEKLFKSPKIEEMRKNIARILNINESSVGITATSGEELTEFGKGNGISVFVCMTTE